MIACVAVSPRPESAQSATHCASILWKSQGERSSCGSVWSIGKPALGFDSNLRYFKRMTETEQAILDTLLELEAAVGRVNAEPKPDLVGLFSRLDELTAQLPRGTSPDLLHYMHKKSFQKARLFLQGQDPEQGDCPH